VSLCKGMDKEPALRRARATLRVARRWAPLGLSGRGVTQSDAPLSARHPARRPPLGAPTTGNAFLWAASFCNLSRQNVCSIVAHHWLRATLRVARRWAPTPKILRPKLHMSLFTCSILGRTVKKRCATISAARRWALRLQKQCEPCSVSQL